ncbi:MAG: glycosyltransferase family 39 protein [Chloroflexi bacterium]|nr:glycosyltransferase family 39 protein [Chloroflexota bacterium]
MREHRHFIIVVTLLTLVVTFPTILYVFRTDVFWLPSEHFDIYIEIWDIWYSRQFLTGQADQFQTNWMFYPDGVSLVYHPFIFPNVIIVHLLSLVLPVSNAYSLAYLLIIGSASVSAYGYLRWLFKDKRIALFGAVVFGFSPHIVGHPQHPGLAVMVFVPLVLYSFHRAIESKHSSPVIVAGALAGSTSAFSLYMYAIVLIMLGFYVCALAKSHWRDKRFWLNVGLLILFLAISSAWRVYPMISNTESLGSIIEWHGANEVRTDAISYVVNHDNPWLGRAAEAILQTPDGPHLSETSFLGYLPLLLVAVGLATKGTRRKMLPWAFLCALFLVLRLGSHLTINGVAFTDVLLPKHFLNQILPAVFGAFWEADHFMIGALLPFAVLTCYGLVALQKRMPIAAKPMFILAFVFIVAVEYYIPTRGKITSDEQIAYLDWLAQENDSDRIRLINLPMGRNNSKRYNLFQALSGYPHAEGAISRTPDRAYDYIRANYLLNAWRRRRPIHCEMADRDAYLAGLAQLEADGFSHVVYHRRFQNWADVKDSFEIAEPSYSDDFVSIYRLSVLRESCPESLSPRQLFTRVYADALQKHSILDERHGTIAVFPPTEQAGRHFLRYLRNFTQVDQTVIAVVRDEAGNISALNSSLPDADAPTDLQQFAALWLVNDALEFNAELTPAFRDWFTDRFQFCERYHEDERLTIDAYVRADIPCSAIDESSAFEVHYDSDVRLRNASYDVRESTLRVFLAWTDATLSAHAFSLQLFDEDGNKAGQYDNVIYDELLTVHEIDVTSLRPGAYTVQLIVYEFESGVSQSGTIVDTGERFDRTLEIAQIEL